MKGHATTQGTQKYQERMARRGLAPAAFRELGRTGWIASTIGFGGYRIDEVTPEHREALEKALTEGCNLIDTSTNYTDGSSELCVGHALTNLFGSSKIQRDEVILVSKVGYVQGSNLEEARAREAAGNPFPEMVKYADGCWHCIHPEFIRSQLARSLDRTSQRQLDVYLLHNPEYFFSDAKRRTPEAPLAELREEFYRRIRAAFVQLEKEVAEGRLQAYGVSSNTFGQPADHFEATSLTRMWEIAGEVAKEHHFSVAQLPLNLFEGGPALNRNNGPDLSQTALEFAREKKIAVLVNRPLNAIVGNQMVRLADFPLDADAGSVDEAAARVARLEGEFGATLAPVIKTQAGSTPASEFFRWGTELARPELKSVPLEHWTQLESQMILPQVNSIVGALNQHFATSPGVWEPWRERYLPELQRLLHLVRNDCSRRSQAVSQTIARRLHDFMPTKARGESLSRKALNVVINTPGVSCVLNGMREPRYVDDSLGAMKMDAFPVKEELFSSFRLAADLS